MVSFLRSAAERLSRNRSFRRSFETRHGPAEIYVSPDAQLKYLKPGRASFDRDLVYVADNFVQNGDTVWDIGANVGVFSFACAVRPQTHVVAIEADPWIGGLLRRSAALTQYRSADIEVLVCAMAERDGVERLQIAARGRASNALASARGRTMMGGVRHELLVPCLSLDTLMTRMAPPDVIKIDIEGAEIGLFRGGAIALRAHRPLIYCEVGHEDFDTVRGLLSALDYRSYNPDGSVAEQPATSNYFFVPKERLAEERFEHFRGISDAGSHGGRSQVA